MKTKLILVSMAVWASCLSFGQGPTGTPEDAQKTAAAKAAADKKAADAAEAKRKAELERLILQRRQALADAERDGIEVRIADISRFRGVRSNQLTGIGLVYGLEGTGDSKKAPFTAQLLANLLRDFGTAVDPAQLNLKNIAAVTVTAELPPFAAPGNRLDVTVESFGDAKSLQGGILLRTPLYGPGDKETAYVVAQGSVSIGGFQAGSNGSSVQKNHLTAGKVPSGGIVEARVATETVFDGKMYLEVEEADFTTAKRIAGTLTEKFPEYGARAVSGGTVELNLPAGKSPVVAMAEIEQTKVFVNIPAVIVINERTGTIVIGGNVKLGPAIVMKGGLNVRIDTLNAVSQPLPFSQGKTTEVSNSNVSVEDTTAQLAVVVPNASVADLARIFLELKVSATDIIAILQELKAQGALKARIKVQ
jgi:flagellar P-ring protein precursor FlgI